MKARSRLLGMSIGFVIVWSTLAAAAPPAFAETFDREIPVLKDGDGNTLTVVLTREEDRRTATPRVTIGERTTDRAATGGEGIAAAAPDRILLPVQPPEEINIRNARKVLRGFRSQWKADRASEAY